VTVQWSTILSVIAVNFPGNGSSCIGYVTECPAILVHGWINYVSDYVQTCCQLLNYGISYRFQLCSLFEYRYQSVNFMGELNYLMYGFWICRALSLSLLLVLLLLLLLMLLQ